MMGNHPTVITVPGCRDSPTVVMPPSVRRHSQSPSPSWVHRPRTAAHESGRPLSPEPRPFSDQRVTTIPVSTRPSLGTWYFNCNAVLIY
jgi:hypothetical protein